LVGIQTSFCFIFLLIMLGDLLCNTKNHLLMPFRVLKKDLQFYFGNHTIQIIWNCHKDFQIMFLFALYGGMMPPSQLRRKNGSTLGFLNMWSFGRGGCARVKPMLNNEAWKHVGHIKNHDFSHQKHNNGPFWWY